LARPGEVALPRLGVSNWRLRLVRQLQQKKHRDAHRLTILEGPRMCETAAAAGADVKLVLVSEAGLRAGAPFVESQIARGVECFVLAGETLARCAPTASPQGLLALVAIPGCKLPEPPYDPLTLVLWLDRVADPGNTGTLIRSADAAGATAVVAAGGADPWGPKAVRASMGSLFSLPVLQISEDDSPDWIADLRAAGMKAVCAGPRGGAWPWLVDLTGPAVLVVGNEAQGISEELWSLADVNVSIPNFGQAESLNVAQAATVLLFEFARQARARETGLV